MVMSPEKYVLLCAKVLDMNSKSLEVDGAEEHRLLGRFPVHRALARTPPTNAQRHTSLPQPHVSVLWLPEDGMVLSPKKYVRLRAKALDMN